MLKDLLIGKTLPSVEEQLTGPFTFLLNRHKLLPQISKSLNVFNDDSHEELKAELNRWAARSMFMFKELILVKESIASLGIRCIVLKGPLLSFQLYEDFHSRFYSDLDLFLEKETLHQALVRLSDLNYVSIGLSISASEDAWNEYFKFNNDIVLRNPETGIAIELHIGVYVEQLLEREKEHLLLAETTAVEIRGTAFRTLAAENNFLYLCFHAAKHMFFRLCWVRDIATFIEKIPMDYDKVIELTRELEMEKSLSLALQLSQHYCGVTLPVKFQEFVVKHRYPRLLNLSHKIIQGPGELVYEDYRKFRKAENQVEGINKVRLKHLVNQVLFLILLRKGFKRRLKFLLYQVQKRS